MGNKSIDTNEEAESLLSEYRWQYAMKYALNYFNIQNVVKQGRVYEHSAMDDFELLFKQQPDTCCQAAYELDSGGEQAPFAKQNFQ